MHIRLDLSVGRQSPEERREEHSRASVLSLLRSLADMLPMLMQGRRDSAAEAATEPDDVEPAEADEPWGADDLDPSAARLEPPISVGDCHYPSPISWTEVGVFIPHWMACEVRRLSLDTLLTLTASTAHEDTLLRWEAQLPLADRCIVAVATDAASHPLLYVNLARLLALLKRPEVLGMLEELTST